MWVNHAATSVNISASVATIWGVEFILILYLFDINAGSTYTITIVYIIKSTHVIYSVVITCLSNIVTLLLLLWLVYLSHHNIRDIVL